MLSNDDFQSLSYKKSQRFNIFEIMTQWTNSDLKALIYEKFYTLTFIKWYNRFYLSHLE